MTETSESSDPRGTRYDAEYKALAYQIWLWEAGRDPSRTVKRLVEEFPDDRPPTVRTIRNWIKDEAWDLRADDDISAIAPQLYRRHNARLAVLQGLALDHWEAVLRGELDADVKPEALLAEKGKAAQAVANQGGMGTAASRFGQVEIPAILVTDSLRGKTALEKAELIHKRMLEAKGES